nr:Chain F, Peptide inhibitor UNC10245109 [Homo sapiens]6OCX_H Chain H, Peptide inhibitor UNC10245109 [Homo sapiens]6OCX_J Chain J, Peptide inhibitor UNC10245109 [Homo sapiens]6OCX_L Chain L, Peptide inhibitor UNC10245109 [Homo sapiens]
DGGSFWYRAMKALYG